MSVTINLTEGNKVTIKRQDPISLTLEKKAASSVSITQQANVAISLQNKAPSFISIIKPGFSGSVTLWGSIAGTVTDQTDLVDYIAEQIADIPTPATPTLQSVTDAGNTTTNSIGIGTASPSALLEISGGGTTTDFLKLTTAAGGATPVKLIFEKTAAEQGIIEFNRNGDLEIYNTDNDGGVLISGSGSATADMYINHSGNVGIGTTAPTENLEISSSGTTTLRIGSTNSFGRGIELRTTGLEAFLDIEGDLSIRKFDGNPLWVGEGKLIIASQYFYGGYINFRKRGDTTNLAQIGLETGSNTYFNTGNFGIGTTAPQQKLHVDGTIRIGSDVDLSRYAGHLRTAQNLVLGSPNYEGANLTINAGSTQNAIGVRRPPSGTTSILKVRDYSTQDVYVDIDSDGNGYFAGNVGIGTTAPASKLEVHQSADSQGLKIVGFDDENNSNLHLFVDNFGNNKIFSTEFLEISAGGSSRYRTAGYLRLEVGGTNNQMQLDHNYMKFTSGGTETMRITPGNVGIGTTAPSEKLQVSGGNILLDTNTWIGSGGGSGQPRLRFDNTNSQGKLQQADLVLNDEKSIAWSNTGTGIQGRGVDNQRIEFNVASSERMRITSNGNVGIGTTAPAAKLHVAGEIRVNAGQPVMLDVANNIYAVAGQNQFRLYSGGNPAFNITTAGNVGIGTTAPTEKLHVDGNIRTSSSTGIGVGTDTVYSNSVNINNSGQYRIGNAEFISKSVNDMSIYQGRMWVTNSRNVGIGTTAPANKLDVNGTFRAGSNSASNSVTIGTSGATTINTTSGNTGLTISDSSNGILALRGGSQTYRFITLGSSQRFEIRDLANADTTRLAITSNGNVGIGTTAPAHKLDVSGSNSTISVFRTTNANADLYLKASGTTSDGKAGIRASANNLLFISNGATQAAFNVGNFGIGTTAPTEKLDVAGNIRAYASTGTVTIGTEKDGNYARLNSDGTSGYISYGNVNGASRVLRFVGNSSEVARFDSSGNLGIGTTAPAAKLDVRGTISQRVDASITANQYPIQLFNDYSGTDYYLLRQRVVDSGTKVRTGLGITGAPDAAFVLGPQTDETIKFAANGNIINLTDITAADPLRINSGEVRIGDISGSAASYLNVIQGASSTKPALGVKQGVGGSNKMITILDSSGAETMGITSEGGFYFRDNNLVGRFAFEHDYSPAGADGLTVGIDLRTEDASGNLQSLGYIDVTQDDISANESSMRLSVGEGTPTEVMRLQSNGNVGIGTTAPDSKLHVSAASGIAFKVNPNNVDKEWYIDTTNPDHLKKEGNLILNADPTGVHTSTFIGLNVDGSNKMRIQHDGTVGIGTTSPTSNLHINGTAMRQLRLEVAGGPSSNTDTAGAEGDFAYDDQYLYIKTGSGWGRVALDFAF